MTTYYIILLALIAAFFVVLEIRETRKEAFYRNPVGKRCRYCFSGKWIKGVVEWNNGDYYYITPDQRKQAYDLIHKSNVKPNSRLL